MTNTYHLSYDEQKAAKARLLAAARMQRLLQVRAQDKQLAKARSRHFKHLCVESAQQLKDELVMLIGQQKERELSLLRAQYQAALEGLATAQRTAAISAQQLAIERQQKHQLFLQRENEAQQRFAAALSRVQAARQAELQVVLNKMQRRQDIMQQQRELARTFTEHQKEQATQDAQQQAELDLLEEQRRRQNQVSRIDFRYSRLHELGVPQLVVNHKELPAEGTLDAATQAQQEAVRTREEQLLLQQHQQENAKKAVERGVNAQMLLQAERNRQRMEQALRELESNEIEQRKQDLATGNLSAAPLLRKWQQQKRKAQARRAFEQDFLPDAGRAQHGLPSFLAFGSDASAAAGPPGRAVARATTAAEQAEDETTPEGQAAAAARALRLVAELEQQRQAEAAAQQQERHRRLQQRAAATAQPSSSAASSELDIPVTVEDLMDFIPAASTQSAPLTLGPRSETADSTSRAAASVPTAEVPASPAGESSEKLAGIPARSAAAAVADASQPAGIAGSGLTSEQQRPESATAAGGATASVSSSQDSVAAIMQAADEVLKQLPAEMQAAAARRAAAAAGRTLPRPSAVGGYRDEVPTLAPTVSAAGAADALHPAAAGTAGTVDTAPVVTPGLGDFNPAGSSSSGSDERRSDRAIDSSADAAAILQELRALQQQLGAELLGSSTAGSDLEQLAAFDGDVQHLLEQRLKPPAAAARRSQEAAAAPAAAPGPVVEQPSSSQQQQLQQSTAPAAVTAAGPQAPSALEYNPDLDSAVDGGVDGAIDHAAESNTELENLIDRILAPDYPTNLFGPLAGPQPSVDSPTHPAGRSGRRAAASSAAAAQQQQQTYDLASGFREIQQELKALGLPSVSLSSLSSSATGDDAALLQSILQSPMSSSTSDLTLPTTVLGAMDPAAVASAYTAAAGGATKPPAEELEGIDGIGGRLSSSSGGAAAPVHRASIQQQQQQVKLQLQSGLLASTSAPSLSISATTAGHQTAGDGLQLPGDNTAPGHQTGAAAAAMAAARQAILDLSSSSDSLSTSTSGTSEIDKLLQNMQLGTAAAAAARKILVENRGVPGSVLSSSVVSMPSTLLQGHAAAAAAVPAFSGSAAAAAAHTAEPTAVPGSVLSSSVISMPSTLLQRPAAAAAVAPKSGSGTAVQGSLAVPARSAVRDISEPVSIGVDVDMASTVVSLPSTLQLRQRGAPPAAADEDPLAVLRELLSLRDSDSDVLSSPTTVHGHAAAAAAGKGPPSVSSSSISSMLDEELDQLLQKAMAGMGSSVQQQRQGSIEKALEAMAGMGSSVQQQRQGSIEKALEAMVVGGGGTAAAATRASLASMSTTIPSTIRARMPDSMAAAAATTTVDAVRGASGGGSLQPPAAPAPAGRAVSPTTSGSSGGSGSGSASSSSRSEAALRMAKQSARQRAAAAAAANAAAAAASAAGGPSSMTSLPSTIERHLDAVAAAANINSSGFGLSAESCDVTLPSTVAVTAAGAGDLRPKEAGEASSSLPSTVERMVNRQQQQQQGNTSWGPGSSSSSLSLPLSLQQQQPWLAGSAGSSSSIDASSGTSFPSTIRRQLPSSSSVNESSSGGSRKGLGLPPRAPPAAAAAAAGAATQYNPAGANTARLQQQQQQEQQTRQSSKPAPAAGVPPALERIEEETTASFSVASGSLGIATTSPSVGSELQRKLTPPQQQKVAEVASSPAAAAAAGLPATPSSSGSSRSTSQVSGSRGAGSSSSGGDGGVSSDSFSGVVSDLMQHIESTLASLPGGSTSSSALADQPAAPAAAAGGRSGGSSDLPMGRTGLVPLQPAAAAAAAAGRVRPQRRSEPLQPAAHSRQNTSTSSSSGSSSIGAGSPSFELPRIETSRSSSSGTDSSTERFIQQALADINAGVDSPESSGSSAGMSSGITGTSGLWQQHHHHQQQQNVTAAALPAAAAAAGLQEDSSTEHFIQETITNMPNEGILTSPESSGSSAGMASGTTQSARLLQQHQQQQAFATNALPPPPPPAAAAEAALQVDSSTEQFIQEANADIIIDGVLMSPDSSSVSVGGATSDPDTSHLLQPQFRQVSLVQATSVSAAAAAAAVVPSRAGLSESAWQFENRLAAPARPTASSSHAAAAAGADGVGQRVRAASPSSSSSASASRSSSSGSTTPLSTAGNTPLPPAPLATAATAAAEHQQLLRQETISSSGDTDQLLGSLGSILAASTPASTGRSAVSQSSGNSSEVSFRGAAIASREQSASAAATAELLAGSAGLSSSDGMRGLLNSSGSSSGSVGQQQQQQPRAESSGLSRLLADILSEDPELAAQLSSQSLG